MSGEEGSVMTGCLRAERREGIDTGAGAGLRARNDIDITTTTTTDRMSTDDESAAEPPR